MVIELDPPRGVGDVRIGMSVGAAEEVLRGLPGFVPPADGEARNKGFAHYASEMSISLDFDSHGVVQGVEVFRPESEVQVRFRGLSLFDEPAESVMSSLAALFRLEVEDDGMQVTAPDVFLGLWRDTLPEHPGDPAGRHFDSVLIAAPGYEA